MYRHHRRSLGLAIAMLILAAAAFASTASTALAQSAQPAAQAQPNDAQSGFVPVKELPPQDKLPAAPLLIAAYAFVWAALLVYVWTIWRRLMKVESEMHDLSSRLASRTGRS